MAQHEDDGDRTDDGTVGQPPASDYKVGPGRPPKASQFKPGQSGNPRGRPKGTRDVRRILEDQLFKPVRIAERGRARSVPYFEAAVMRLKKDALDGNARAMDRLIRLLPLLEDDPRAEGGRPGREGGQGLAGRADPDAPLAPREDALLAEFVRDWNEQHEPTQAKAEPRSNGRQSPVAGALPASPVAEVLPASPMAAVLPASPPAEALPASPVARALPAPLPAPRPVVLPAPRPATLPAVLPAALPAPRPGARPAARSKEDWS